MAMSKGNIPASVEEYLNTFPANIRSTLEKVRKAIKEAAPMAEEVISYQIPTYKYLGALVHYAAFKDHCSFFGVSKSLLENFKKQLQPYKVTGTTIHFWVDKPLPSALVKKMVKARIKENEERTYIKKNQSKKKQLKINNMEKMNFSIDINAPKEKVWEVLWGDSTYRKWTSAFSEGSHAITDWKEGSKVLFLDGKGAGMVSKIETKRPNEFMSFQHLGMVKDGVEDMESDKVKEWAGALENYTLTETGGITTLAVDMDISEEYKDYFIQTFPKALEQVKTLAENKW